MKARIIDIKRFAIHDGKGIRTTVFFKGCPLKCVWCHNPESISQNKAIWYLKENCIHCHKCLECPSNAISVDEKDMIKINKELCDFCGYCVENCPGNALERIDREVSIQDILEEVKKDEVYYNISDGGVTLSGGEPFYQKEFVIALLKELKKGGFSTCVETSMYCDQGTLKKAVEFTDKFFVDIKFFDSELHKKFTGVTNKIIIDNFLFLAENAKFIEVRIPLIPGITATSENLKSIAGFVKKVNPKIQIELLNFNNLGNSKYKRLDIDSACLHCTPFSDGEFKNLKNMVKQNK